VQSSSLTILHYQSLQVARLCNEWNIDQRGTATNSTSDRLGLVVGATDLEALNRVRILCPTMWILCPGVGAQGGEVEVKFTYSSHLYIALFDWSFLLCVQ